MAGLAQRQILGSRAVNGRVYVPPAEYDPVTFAPPQELVTVGPGGTVLTWSWQPEPREGQPLDHPFAWALIELDGANTGLLHAVDAGTAANMHTGMRVRPRWADSPAGHITDIVCFEPVSDDPSDRAASAARRPRSHHECRRRPWHDHHADTPALRPQRFGRGEPVPARPGGGQGHRPAVSRLRQGLRAAPRCVPGRRRADDDRRRASRCWHGNDVLRRERPVPGAAGALPVRGRLGAAGRCRHRVPAPDTRLRRRPRSGWACGYAAVWKPRDQWGTTSENIDHFEPTGEPDAPYDSYAHHL